MHKRFFILALGSPVLSEVCTEGLVFTNERAESVGARETQDWIGGKTLM